MRRHAVPPLRQSPRRGADAFAGRSPAPRSRSRARTSASTLADQTLPSAAVSASSPATCGSQSMSAKPLCYRPAPASSVTACAQSAQLIRLRESSESSDACRLFGRVPSPFDSCGRGRDTRPSVRGTGKGGCSLKNRYCRYADRLCRAERNSRPGGTTLVEQRLVGAERCLRQSLRLAPA